MIWVWWREGCVSWCGTMGFHVLVTWTDFLLFSLTGLDVDDFHYC